MNLSRRLSLIFFLFVPFLDAQDAQLEQKFKDALKGKVLLLRDFASDKEIKIDGDGKLLRPIHQGPWTLAYMEIYNVRARKKKLELEGPRVALLYDESKKKLVATRTTKERVSVEIESPFSGTTDQIFQRVTEALFVPEGSQVGSLPDY